MRLLVGAWVRRILQLGEAPLQSQWAVRELTHQMACPLPFRLRGVGPGRVMGAVDGIGLGRGRFVVVEMSRLQGIWGVGFKVWELVVVWKIVLL